MNKRDYALLDSLGILTDEDRFQTFIEEHPELAEL